MAEPKEETSPSSNSSNVAAATTANKKSFIGSCHCGAIRYKVSLALPAPPAQPTASRCNCTICQKQGFTGVRIDDPTHDFTLLSPASLDQLSDYQFRSPDIHNYFCGRCGVSVLGAGKFEYQNQVHELFKLNVLTLEQPQEGLDLSTFKIKYWDGRNDNWMAGQKDMPWPGGCL